LFAAAQPHPPASAMRPAIACGNGTAWNARRRFLATCPPAQQGWPKRLSLRWEYPRIWRPSATTPTRAEATVPTITARAPVHFLAAAWRLRAGSLARRFPLCSPSMVALVDVLRPERARAQRISPRTLRQLCGADGARPRVRSSPSMVALVDVLRPERAPSQRISPRTLRQLCGADGAKPRVRSSTAHKSASCNSVTTAWPSGLRRWLKAPFRKGVGSNPTGVIFGHPSIICCITIYPWMVISTYRRTGTKLKQDP
jgi:hypothetical protein